MIKFVMCFIIRLGLGHCFGVGLGSDLFGLLASSGCYPAASGSSASVIRSRISGLAVRLVKILPWVPALKL